MHGLRPRPDCQRPVFWMSQLLTSLPELLSVGLGLALFLTQIFISITGEGSEVSWKAVTG